MKIEHVKLTVALVKQYSEVLRAIERIRWNGSTPIPPPGWIVVRPGLDLVPVQLGILEFKTGDTVYSGDGKFLGYWWGDTASGSLLKKEQDGRIECK